MNTSTASSSTSKVWLITGCSSGFGREIALAALARGDRVIATARRVDSLEDLKAKGATTLTLDVTASEHVLSQVVADAVQRFGRLDILFNNAGYALHGTVEETSAKETLDQFQTLVFGPLSLSRAVLPYFRAQRSGVIANMGSVSAWRGAAAMSVYSGAKAALATLSQALRVEVASLGIDVTVVEPGYFRTDVLGSRRVTAEKRIEDYAPLRREAAVEVDGVAGKEPGDPERAARLLVDALTKSGQCAGLTLPARLPLGKMAITIVEHTLATARQELRDWSALAAATDFDADAEQKA